MLECVQQEILSRNDHDHAAIFEAPLFTAEHLKWQYGKLDLVYKLKVDNVDWRATNIRRRLHLHIIMHYKVV